MAITIELPPELEANLREAAHRGGKSMETYLLELVERSRADDAARERGVRSEAGGPRRTRSLLELEGVGAELWKDIDPQAYVSELRDEWEHRG